MSDQFRPPAQPDDAAHEQPERPLPNADSAQDARSVQPGQDPAGVSGPSEAPAFGAAFGNPYSNSGQASSPYAQGASVAPRSPYSSSAPAAPASPIGGNADAAQTPLSVPGAVPPVGSGPSAGAPQPGPFGRPDPFGQAGYSGQPGQPGPSGQPGQADPSASAWSSAPGGPYTPGGPTGPYGPAGSGPYGPTGQGPTGPRRPNVLGLIGLGVSVLGAILAAIAATMPAGWFLLVVGLILSVVALFQRDRAKWPAITGIVASVVGAIISVIVLAVTFSHALSGFATGDDSPTPDPLPSFTDSLPALPDLPEASEPPMSDDASSTDADDLGYVSFGERAVFSDGLAITVTAPEEFTPSADAEGATQAHNVRMTVTVENGSDHDYDLTGFQLSGSSFSGDDYQSADVVYDDTVGYYDDEDDIVAPGESITFQVGLSVGDPTQVNLDLQPSVDQYVSFTNY